MKTYKTHGIILRSFKLKEADRILTILSPTNGRIEAVAKGVRKTKSKFGSRLEPFSEVALILYNGRALDTVTQAQTLHSFKDIREDLPKTAIGLSMLEITDKVSMHGDDAREVYELLCSALSALEQCTGNPEIIALAYDIKLLAASGFDPILDRCSSCDATSAQTLLFSPYFGGIICSDCAPHAGSREGIDSIGSIDTDALNVWRYLRNASMEAIGAKAGNVELTGERFGRVASAVRGFVAHTFDVKLRSRDVIATLGLRSSVKDAI